MPRTNGIRVGIPDYGWDPDLHNYVNLTSGRMVSRATVNDLLFDVVDRAGDIMGELARGASNGTLSPQMFYEAMQREVRHAYNASAAMGSGGWAQVSKSDWGKNGRQLRDEYQYLRDFAQDLADGKLTEKQAIARARLYADSAYQRYWEIWEKQQAALGNDQEHFVTVGDERVCPVCGGLEAQGWVPLESLPMPGEPHAGCRCKKDYRKAPKAKAGALWLSVKDFNRAMVEAA